MGLAGDAAGSPSGSPLRPRLPTEMKVASSLNFALSSIFELTDHYREGQVVVVVVVVVQSGKEVSIMAPEDRAHVA
ncbi:hypothetical protein E2C01_099477 [Portunus trituberculatus]|uniref:Uncharacterized protein n=1 Tax=Portunus trituberculatus TaxID=210409 RepID=A0A5B7K5K5_PORTR|nr:hypothetical protein [Portunus trituberculatus]